MCVGVGVCVCVCVCDCVSMHVCAIPVLESPLLPCVLMSMNQ